MPKYWVTWVKVIGVRQRGGAKTYLKFLPIRLLRPGTKPPPLSETELLANNMLDRLTPKKTGLYSGSSRAYPSVISKHCRGKLLSRTARVAGPAMPPYFFFIFSNVRPAPVRRVGRR